MPDSIVDSNPFQAPTAPPDEARLPPDTDFLFNDSVIAGVGTIVLPKVCVVSGSQHSLLAKEDRLSSCSRWFSFCRGTMIFFALFVGLPMLNDVSRLRQATSGAWSLMAVMQMSAAIGMIAGAASMIGLGFIVRRAVRVQWFISQQAERRFRYIWVVNLGLSVGLLFTACIFVLRPAHTSWDILVPPLIWTSISIVRLFRGKRVLYIADWQDGLFLVAGMSDKFLTEVKRMVEEYNRRIAS